MNTLSKPTSVVFVQFEPRRVVGETEIGAHRFVHRCEVAGREQIGPSVVVVVEEPGGKSVTGTGHAGGPRQLGERVVAVVPIEKVAALEIRDVEVHEPVVVVVGRGHSFRECHAIDARRSRDVLEHRPALVQEQLRGAFLVADEQIEQAIAVDVGPGRGLRAGGWLCQSARHGNVGERAIAVVPQQRLALWHLPSSAQQQNVLAAVVVVVGLHHIQPAQLTIEPGV
jgi:hypothetical protein